MLDCCWCCYAGPEHETLQLMHVPPESFLRRLLETCSTTLASGDRCSGSCTASGRHGTLRTPGAGFCCRASAVGLKAWAILLSHLLMQGHRWLGDTPAALRISGCNFVASDGKLGFESEVGAGRNARYCAKACVPMARAGRTLVNSCRGSPLNDKKPIIGSASVITRSHSHQRA